MINIRPATEKDYPRVLELIQELATFEKEPDAVEVTVEELQKHAFSKPPLFTCFIGEYDDKIEGIALCYPRFSTWKGKSIHLEDLIVTHKMRGKGLGKALYNRVLEFAHAQNVRRVEWVVLDWNKGAIDFYKSSGATIIPGWHLVQMDGVSLAQYLEK
ncbi:GNAT family N-acetyltransferase [Nonlabens antarcticus]|uniref:GNAT family N-acetyltransferase n=1 Tax=Nonlabens antarcticus TaxID=392714 RepID=UPI001890E51C|nr:GNAT family N-acetyltransferase [Nonlabens antarcticus]